MEFISSVNPITTTTTSTNQSSPTQSSIQSANMTTDSSLISNGNTKLVQDQHRFQVQGSHKPLASPLDTSNTLNHSNCQQSDLTLYQHSITNDSKSLNNESIDIYETICKPLEKPPSSKDAIHTSSPLDGCLRPTGSSAQAIGQCKTQEIPQHDNDLIDFDVRQLLSQLLENFDKFGSTLASDLPSEQNHQTNVNTTELAMITCSSTTNITTGSLIDNSGIADGFEDLPDDRNKDIVTLKNLEISPPPPLVIDEDTLITNEDKSSDSANEKNPSNIIATSKSNSRSNPSSKRPRDDSLDSKSDHDISTESNSRSKRQRTQTKLYQAEIPIESKTSRPSPAPSPVKTRSRQPYKPTKAKSPSLSSAQATNVVTHDLESAPTSSSLLCPMQHSQEMIHYEKYAYLAIRNEENSFYLCQLLENVKLDSANIKVKWLDTDDAGKTYYLTQHYDSIPQKSILMPVDLTKLNRDKKAKVKQLFVLEEQNLEVINDRLKRSLIANTLEQGSK